MFEKKKDLKKTEVESTLMNKIEVPAVEKKLPRLTTKEKCQVVLSGLNSPQVENELKKFQGKKRDLDEFEKSIKSIGQKEIGFLLNNLSYIRNSGKSKEEVLEGMSIRQLLRVVEKRSK